MKKRILPVLAVLAAATACGLLPEERACTDEARASVQVTVVDSAGAPVPSPTVTFDSASGQSGACETFPGADEAHPEFVCGFEVAGDITVHASADPALFQAVDKTVHVGETDDGCHVVTEQLEITLPAAG